MTTESFKDIFDAAQHGSVEDVKYFVEEQGADVHAKDEHSITPLHYAAWKNTVDVVQYLVSQGADVKVKDDDATQHWYMTPLHFAAWKNTVDVVQYLVSRGAEVNLKCNSGETPLYYAAKNNTVEVLQYLVSQPDTDATISNASALLMSLTSATKSMRSPLNSHRRQ